MKVEVVYFFEKTDQDYITYNKLWDDNRERMIFLHKNLSSKHQLNSIINNMNTNKDILAVRFPNNYIHRNKIIKSVMSGKGVQIDKDNVWYPKELWIYN